MAETPQQSNKPELNIGPFPGGIGVAVWRNEIKTDAGPRFVRSITIAPRRYRDKESAQWKDASSYRSIDLPAIILALQKAYEYCQTTPLPGHDDQAEMPF